MMFKNLIIQGRDIQTTTLKDLAKLSGAAAISAIASQNIHHQAFRMSNADDRTLATIAPICAAAELDFGFIPASRDINDFKLLVMDMDSTLITIECIDEVADLNNIKPQVAAITAAAMRGEIEFSESLNRRVALLAGLDESVLQQVYEQRLQLSPGAETLLRTLQQHGIKTLLVSGGFTFFTNRLQARLNLDYSKANNLEISNGKLTGRVLGDILDAQAKADWLVRIGAQLGISRNQIIAIGDGANDLLMLKQAGVSIAYHAKPIVREQAAYALNFNDLSAVLPLLGQT